MRRVAVALGAVVAAAAVALPAFAGHTTQTDGNDTGGKLDARSVAFDHDGSPLRWRIVTFGGWTIRELWDTGYLVVQLDTRGDERVDHVAVVRSDGRKLVGTLYRVRRDGTQRAIGAVPAGKSGPGGVSISVPFHRLTIGSGRLSYFWSVVTSFTAAACPRTCLDLVPDDGMIEQPLPGVTPTPTPSPTPSPTPTP